MHSNQRPACLLTGGDGAGNVVQSMHGMDRAALEPRAEQKHWVSVQENGTVRLEAGVLGCTGTA